MKNAKRWRGLVKSAVREHSHSIAAIKKHVTTHCVSGAKQEARFSHYSITFSYQQLMKCQLMD